MKKRCIFLGFTYLFIACQNPSSTTESQMGHSTQGITHEENLPPLSNPGEGAYQMANLLYQLDEKPTPECHASTLVETSSGILCAFFAGTYERHPDVGIRIAQWKDGKWSKSVEVANGVQNDSLRYPCWNPVLFYPTGGPLMLFYKVGPNPREWWGMLMTSDDEGQSWSEPKKLGEHEKIGHILGPVRCKPIQLADGSILCPSSTESETDEDIFWKVHFERTRDKGKTWEIIGPINEGITFDAIQPTILQYGDTSMQILCRTRENVVAESWSYDQGNSWTELQATELPNPSAGVDGMSLRDGRKVLIYNHAVRGGKSKSGRHMLNVAISKDGEAWKPIMTLEDDATNEAGYSYPAVIQSQDGLIHITYTYIRESIKHVILDPEKI